jgi:hypothetical protein
MATTTSSTSLVPVQPVFTGAERLALALAGYRGLTREAYTLDLRQFTSWCRTRSLPLFSVRRADIETFAHGVLFYDFLIVSHDQARLFLEFAIRERFVDFHGGAAQFRDKAGELHANWFTGTHFPDQHAGVQRDRRIGLPRPRSRLGDVKAACAATVLGCCFQEGRHSPCGRMLALALAAERGWSWPAGPRRLHAFYSAGTPRRRELPRRPPLSTIDRRAATCPS